jgi:hypothetical protein
VYTEKWNVIIQKTAMLLCVSQLSLLLAALSFALRVVGAIVLTAATLSLSVELSLHSYRPVHHSASAQRESDTYCVV